MWFWVLENYQEIIKLAIFITQMTFKPQSATLIKPTTNWRTHAGLVEITFYSKSRQTVLNSAEEHFSAQLQKHCDSTLSQEKEVGKYRAGAAASVCHRSAKRGEMSRGSSG